MVAAEGGGQQLVAEADPEDGHRARAGQVADLADDGGQGGRVAGPVGEEDPVGLEAEHLVGRASRPAPR